MADFLMTAAATSTEVTVYAITEAGERDVIERMGRGVVSFQVAAQLADQYVERLAQRGLTVEDAR